VLLERIAADVARALLARFKRVLEVQVKVEKPEPAGLDAAAEAVELTIARPRSARATRPRSPRRRHA
jgi:dihydroneopterin aldolase